MTIQVKVPTEAVYNLDENQWQKMVVYVYWLMGERWANTLPDDSNWEFVTFGKK